MSSEGQDFETEDDFDGLRLISEQKANQLREAGYDSYDDLNDASVRELVEVDGIGTALAQAVTVQAAEKVGDSE